jgi:hypothetical protein
MNGYVSLGSYDDVHKKIDYTVFAPEDMKQYFRSYNSDLFSYADVERRRIEDLSKTNDPTTRYEYRFDTSFPDKTRESVRGTPHNLGTVLKENFSTNLKEVAKQSILLEEKMRNGETADIPRHVLTIEGYLEDAMAINNNLEYADTIQELMREFRELSQEIFTILKHNSDIRTDRWYKIAQKLHKFREPLVRQYAVNL